jgi:P63C domain
MVEGEEDVQSSAGRPDKDNAVELGRRGGLKGGKARAAGMTSGELTEASRDAAIARWDKVRGVVRALKDGTIKLGNAEIDCAVVPGEIRVLSQRSMMKALNRHRPGGRGTTDPDSDDVDIMPRFAAAKNLQPFISDELRLALLQPILYRAAGPKGNGGQPAQGIKAELLADICVVYLDAERAGKLKPQQHGAAEAARVLHKALAKTGIVALVDEATGYQYERARTALADIFEAFISKELAPWVKTFQDEFYQQLFRLRGIKTDDIRKRPQYFGKLTNEIVYARLAPGVLQELRHKNPTMETGVRRDKHHQHLTREVGHEKLKDHLVAATALMKVNDDYKAFIAQLDKFAPKFKPVDATLWLPGFKP